jgi:hypothetical protein
MNGDSQLRTSAGTMSITGLLLLVIVFYLLNHLSMVLGGMGSIESDWRSS